MLNGKQFVTLLLCLALPLIAGGIGGLFTNMSVDTWYQTLTKPSFTPPGWLFGPVWTLLYLMMGIASFLVLNHGWGVAAVHAGIYWYIAQLIANVGWSAAFFGLRSPLGGLVIILLLLAFLVTTIFRFHRVSRIAAYLLIPYILWVSFATVLNIALVIMN
jgi:tryptophan-rich sensory protein